MTFTSFAGNSDGEGKLAMDIPRESSSEQVSDWELVPDQATQLNSQDLRNAHDLRRLQTINKDILPNSIYLLFCSPARSDGYHRGIFVTNSFKVDKDLPSGTLFHAVYGKGDFFWTKECWRLVRRSISNIHDLTSVTLAYRIGHFLGGSTEIAHEVYRLEQKLSSVKLEATPERMEKSSGQYSSRIWTEDALSALVNKMMPGTFLLSLNFTADENRKIRPEVIIAEANLARHLVEEDYCVPGELTVFN